MTAELTAEPTSLAAMANVSERVARERVDQERRQDGKNGHDER